MRHTETQPQKKKSDWESVCPYEGHVLKEKVNFKTKKLKTKILFRTKNRLLRFKLAKHTYICTQ